jgi:hypothetical protein
MMVCAVGISWVVAGVAPAQAASRRAIPAISGINLKCFISFSYISGYIWHGFTVEISNN